MKLYENAWRSSYEEIKTWYPVWYREVLEMDALWRAWGAHLDAVQAGIVRAVDNNSIRYADARTIAELEAFLGIVYDGPRTLSERRNVLKALFTGTGHIGQREIKELVSVLADGEIGVALVGGTVQVTVTREMSDRFNLYDCHLILDKIIPAHLGLSFIDNLNAVRIANENRFVFLRLNVRAASRHPGRALCKNFGAKIRFVNYGVDTDRVCLDGRKTLDGSWQLGEKKVGVIAGLAARVFAASAYRFKNGGNIKAIYQYSALAENAMALQNTNVGFGGLSCRQSYRLGGRLKKSYRWELDGSVRLNGAKKLNSEITEEEL